MMDELSQGYGHLRQAAAHFASGAAGGLTPTYGRARIMAGRGLTTAREAMMPAMEQMRPTYRNLKQGAEHAKMRARGHARTMQGAMASQAHLSRRQKRKLKEAARHRMGPLTGLLVAGAAIGAASAIVARRRRAAQWQAYQPMPGGDVMAAAEHHGYDEARYGQTRGRRFLKFGQAKYGSESARARGSSKVTAGAASMVDTLAGRAGRIADNLHERAHAQDTHADQAQHGQRGAQHAQGPHGPHANGPFGGQERSMSGAPGRPATGPSRMPEAGPTRPPGPMASGQDNPALDRSSVDRPASPNRTRTDYPGRM